MMVGKTKMSQQQKINLIFEYLEILIDSRIKIHLEKQYSNSREMEKIKTLEYEPTKKLIKKELEEFLKTPLH